MLCAMFTRLWRSVHAHGGSLVEFSVLVLQNGYLLKGSERGPKHAHAGFNNGSAQVDSQGCMRDCTFFEAPWGSVAIRASCCCGSAGLGHPDFLILGRGPRSCQNYRELTSCIRHYGSFAVHLVHMVMQVQEQLTSGSTCTFARGFSGADFVQRLICSRIYRRLAAA